MHSPRLLLTTAAAAAMLAATAVQASAEVYCVGDAPDCTGVDVENDDLQHALDLAQATTKSVDVVKVGKGVYATETAFHYDSGGVAGNNLVLVGSGRDTVLRTKSDDSGGATGALLRVKGAGATMISGLRLQLPATADKAAGVSGAQIAAARLEHVTVERIPGAVGLTRHGLVLEDDATVRHAQISLPGAYGPAVEVLGSGAELTDLAITGGDAGIRLGQGTRLSRARIDATGPMDPGVYCIACHAEVDDVAILVDDVDDGVRVSAYGGPAHLDANHLTIAAAPGAGSLEGAAGVVAVGWAADAGVRLENCVLDGVGTTLSRLVPAGQAGIATIVARHCNYPLDRESQVGGGSIDSPDSTALPSGFVDAAAGDLRLAWNSPLLDRGRAPDFTAAPFALDGLTRVVDGDLDGAAEPDLGAYEYQSLAPVAKVAKAVAPGGAVTLDAAASHGGDPGEPVAYAWTLPGGVVKTTPAVTFVPPAGRHTATLTVTDPTGRTAKTTVPVTGPHPTGGDPTALMHDATVQVRRRRATLKLALERPAGLTARVQRRRDGRWRTARRIARSLPAGTARVRLGRKPLAPGRWRVRAAATAGAERATATVRFRIRRGA